MRRAPADQIEPEFEDWVIIERAGDPAPDRRGPYPGHIEEKVEQAKRLIAILRNMEGRS